MTIYYFELYPEGAPTIDSYVLKYLIMYILNLDSNN